jgi:signal transduction histidine kinase/ActR/RegA family two-component response regulator
MERAFTNRLIAISLLVVTVFIIDFFMPPDVAASALYVIPIMLTIGLRSSRILAAITMATVIGSILDHLSITQLEGRHYLWADTLLAVTAQLTVASVALMQLRSNQRERETYERAESERRRLAFVHLVAAATSRTLDLDSLLKAIADSMTTLFAVDIVAIWLADENGNELTMAYSTSEEQRMVTQRYDRIDWRTSPAGTAEAIRRRRAMVVGKGYEEWTTSIEILGLLKAEMCVLAPLFTHEQLVGALAMTIRQAREFREDDLAVVETVSKQIATALDNARLFSDINKQRERLAQVYEIGQVFASTLDLNRIYLAVYERLKAIIDCETLLISLYDAESATIHCAFAYTDGEVVPTSVFEPLMLGAGPQSDCIRTAQPIVVNNIVRRPPSVMHIIGKSPQSPISILYVPMMSEEKVIGVIQAQSVREAAYSDEDVPLLSIIANQAAAAIQNARLYGEALAGRQAMERANQIKEEFLAILSHELRTPLTPILGWTRILKRLPADDEETRTHGLAVIERNARLQTQLVNDLLDVSRIESGKLSIYAQAVDLNATIQGAVESLHNDAESHGLRIEMQLTADDATVLADPSRLEQIITNLLTNALKFTDEGGVITVSTAREDHHCKLIVADTGIGIATDFLPHIFERFRQADSPSQRAHSGLGLGLSIVKSLVEMHGGEVTAESGGEGHGARFIVQLPRAPKGAIKVSRDTGPLGLKISDLPSLQLLVVEDDSDTLEMMRVLCGTQNIQIIEASNAEDALKLLEEAHPDVIISDLLLPGIDGCEFAWHVRMDGRSSDIPMIALTGLVSDEDRDRALNAGFNLYLSKPLDYHQFFKAVRDIANPPTASAD